MTSKKVLGALSLAAVLGVAGLGVAGANAFTDQTTNVTYSVAIDETQSIQTSSASITAEATNGQLATAIAAGSLSHTLTYSTNNATGYTVTASVETDANLTSGGNTIAYSDSTIDASGASRWNLTADGTIVALASATSAEIASGAAPASGETTNVTFAAFVDDTQESGTYTKQVTYTLAAEA